MRSAQAMMTVLMLTVIGCTGVEDATSTPTPGSPWLLNYGIAIDAGCPWDEDEIVRAVEEGISRWTGEETGIYAQLQGVTDVATLEDDGLQMIWIWWGSQPWMADEDAWMMHRRYDRVGPSGFDMAIQAPLCPGYDAEGSAIPQALANGVALGVGLGLGVIPAADPGSPLAEGQCEHQQLLLPTAAELNAASAL